MDLLAVSSQVVEGDIDQSAIQSGTPVNLSTFDCRAFCFEVKPHDRASGDHAVQTGRGIRDDDTIEFSRCPAALLHELKLHSGMITFHPSLTSATPAF